MIELTSFFSFPFVQRALIAGILLAIVGSLLGVFVVLKRMSFYSDAIAHASLTGIAIGLLFNLDPTIGAIAISILVGISMAYLMKRKTLSSDTIIGVLFSSSIALAIFIISLLPQLSVDLTALLFGNILTTSMVDIILAAVILVLVIIFVRVYTKPMLKSIFNEDIAQVEHKHVGLMNYLFLALLSITIAVSLKILGAILVSALIIIPAATAQNISKNLRQMFLLAVGIALLSVIVGMFLSYLLDSPSGATIVLTATLLFIVSLLFKKS